MLRIALPNKGRLATETRELFEDAGLDVRVTSDRALTASLGGEFQALFVRAQDIPVFVADGAADAGVTGRDLICESECGLDSRMDLGFGRCRMVVATREDSSVRSVEDLDGRPRVATSFPRITRRFFERIGCPVDIVPVSGATEVAPLLGVADIVVDLTSTGSTLRVNGLREIGTILESTAQLVTGRDAFALGSDRARALDELIAALTSVLRARGKRYLMANVPRVALEDIKRILPGLNGPTVVDILNSGAHVAVHAVVQASGIYRTIAELKSLGAEGILVTRIERLMP